MGAISFVVGAVGSVYKSPDGKEYQLSGWELGIIADYERYLEQRAIDALSRQKLTPEQRSAAMAYLAEDIACFAFSYPGERFNRSLRHIEGLGYFFWLLIGKKVTLEVARGLVVNEPDKVLEAVYMADPPNRVPETTTKTTD